MRTKLFALLLLAFTAVSLTSFAADVPKFSVANHAVLGGDGGWDYLFFDSAMRRVYIGRSDRVMVVDADSLKLIGEIPKMQRVHGVAIAPDLKRGFISDGGENAVVVFDPATLKEIKRVTVDEHPDAIVYDPVSKRVFTFNAKGHDTTAVDADSMTAVGNLPLGGKPEFAAPDGKGDMWVNIEDKSEIVKFDAKNLKELGRYPLAPCTEPSGLAMDQKNGRLFVGCDNEMVAVVDANTGKVITTEKAGPGIDAVTFDPGLGLAFSSNGQAGTLTVIHEESPDSFKVVQDVETKKSARTHTLDPDTHRIFLVGADVTMENGKRTMVPNSFEILVVGPQK